MWFIIGFVVGALLGGGGVGYLMWKYQEKIRRAESIISAKPTG